MSCLHLARSTEEQETIVHSHPLHPCSCSLITCHYACFSVVLQTQGGSHRCEVKWGSLLLHGLMEICGIVSDISLTVNVCPVKAKDHFVKRKDEYILYCLHSADYWLPNAWSCSSKEDTRVQCRKCLVVFSFRSTLAVSREVMKMDTTSSTRGIHLNERLQLVIKIFPSCCWLSATFISVFLR